jgi:hypothetical protein
MIYYRVALKGDQSTTWRWISTVLTSLEALFGFLRLYNMIPRDRIRVFFSSSVESMDLMLARENKGLASNSITADQLLNGSGKISSAEMTRLESESGTRESMGMVVASIPREQPLNEKSESSPPERNMSFLDMRRLESELGTPGDHDTPYKFTLPTSMPQALAWMKLLVKIHAGELEP